MLIERENVQLRIRDEEFGKYKAMGFVEYIAEKPTKKETKETNSKKNSNK